MTISTFTKSIACRATLAAALLTPAIALADDTKPAPVAPEKAKLSEVDAQLLTELHAVNLMEIEMGKLAKAHGTKATKAYGQMLVTDHTKADRNLLALAKKYDFTPADHPEPKSDAERDEMSKEMALMDRLKTLDGAAFDAELLPAMVEGHQGVLDKIEAGTDTSSDAKVKAFLAKVKPVVQKHLDRAKALSSGAHAAK